MPSPSAPLAACSDHEADSESSDHDSLVDPIDDIGASLHKLRLQLASSMPPVDPEVASKLLALKLQFTPENVVGVRNGILAARLMREIASDKGHIDQNDADMIASTAMGRPTFLSRDDPGASPSRPPSGGCDARSELVSQIDVNR